MADQETKERIRMATVHLPGTGGQGVLVPGGYILTAAHCIRWDGAGAMTLGDFFIEDVNTKSGTAFRLGPVVAEPVSDIAVLGELDNQQFGDDCEAFEAWREATSPVFVSERTIETGESLHVHVLSHLGNWITGRVARYGFPGLPGACLPIETDEPVLSGTSGGPIVDDSGLLVGVVSWTGGAQPEESTGMMPVPHLALPRWVWDRVAAATREG